MTPATFWRLTLAEWRAILEGYEQRHEDTRYQQAWTVSYLLIAAGCDAAKVTPEKLLGLKEQKTRRSKPKPELSLNEIFLRMRRVDENGKPMKLKAKAAVDGKV